MKMSRKYFRVNIVRQARCWLQLSSGMGIVLISLRKSICLIPERYSFVQYLLFCACECWRTRRVSSTASLFFSTEFFKTRAKEKRMGKEKSHSLSKWEMTRKKNVSSSSSVSISFLINRFPSLFFLIRLRFFSLFFSPCSPILFSRRQRSNIMRTRLVLPMRIQT